MVSRPIKLLYIIDWIPSDRGGTERQLLYLLRGLNPSKYQVHLICLKTTDWLEIHSANLGCVVHAANIFRFKNPITYLNILKLVLLIRLIRPDIVQTLFPISNIVGILAAHLARVRCLISSRRDYGQWMNPLSLFFTKIANRFLTGILINSFNVKKLTSEREKFPTERITVIYNGVDIERFTSNVIDNDKLRTSLNIPSDHKIVGIIANLRPMKHLDTFILSAGEILKVRSDIHFILVGRGPSEKVLKDLVTKLEITKNIHFVGSQQNILPYLSLFDVAVNCSAQESLSNAIIEYMAFGVPIVVSNKGGNTELIQHGENGFLFELDDYRALARNILKLLNDKALRQQFSIKSREMIRKSFSMDKMILAHEEYYQAICTPRAFH